MRSISVILAAGAIGAGIAGFAVLRRLASRSPEEIVMESVLKSEITSQVIAWDPEQSPLPQVELTDITSRCVCGVFMRTDPRLALLARHRRSRSPKKTTSPIPANGTTRPAGEKNFIPADDRQVKGAASPVTTSGVQTNDQQAGSDSCGSTTPGKDTDDQKAGDAAGPITTKKETRGPSGVKDYTLTDEPQTGNATSPSFVKEDTSGSTAVKDSTPSGIGEGQAQATTSSSTSEEDTTDPSDVPDCIPVGGQQAEAASSQNGATTEDDVTDLSEGDSTLVIKPREDVAISQMINSDEHTTSLSGVSDYTLLVAQDDRPVHCLSDADEGDTTNPSDVKDKIHVDHTDDVAPASPSLISQEGVGGRSRVKTTTLLIESTADDNTASEEDSASMSGVRYFIPWDDTQVRAAAVRASINEDTEGPLSMEDCIPSDEKKKETFTSPNCTPEGNTAGLSGSKTYIQIDSHHVVTAACRGTTNAKEDTTCLLCVKDQTQTDAQQEGAPIGQNAATQEDTADTSDAKYQTPSDNMPSASSEENTTSPCSSDKDMPVTKGQKKVSSDPHASDSSAVKDNAQQIRNPISPSILNNKNATSSLGVKDDSRTRNGEAQAIARILQDTGPSGVGNCTSSSTSNEDTFQPTNLKDYIPTHGQQAEVTTSPKGNDECTVGPFSEGNKLSADDLRTEAAARLSTTGRDTNRQNVCVLKIKNGLMGRIIGKKGKNLKLINKTCGVKTHYGRLDVAHQFLRIEGVAEKTDEAKKLAYHFVAKGISEIPVSEIEGRPLQDCLEDNTVTKNYYSTNRQYGRVVGHNGNNIKALRKLGVKISVSSVAGLKCLAVTGNAENIQAACQWMKDHLASSLFTPAPALPTVSAAERVDVCSPEPAHAPVSSPVSPSKS